MTEPAKPDALLDPEELKPVAELTGQLLGQIDAMLLGRPALHKLVLIGILSRGHVLLEGVPGVGKTALVKALSQLLGLDFKRVQFTPDLMPGDILGANILQETPGAGREMVFTPGPIFTNLLLADEINRASPKTQSALLEAMQERNVTLLGSTRKLPDPFFVLATQNPIELEGTYPLPEAQLDRFLFKLVVDSADVDALERIISTRRRGETPAASWSMTADQLREVFSVMDRIFLPRAVARYIARLVEATHPTSVDAPKLVKGYVAYGASPRAAIAIAEAARAAALLDGRPTVGFVDVQKVTPPVLVHRLILNYKARLDSVDGFAVVRELLATLDEVGVKLPRDLSIAEVNHV